MPAQEKLSPTEQYLAYLIGLGVALIVVALFLIAIGSIDNDAITTSLLLVGIVIVVLGVAGWLIMLKPWEKFDDLQTPHYTGHEHPPEEAEAIAPVAEPAEAPAPPAAPKVEAEAPPVEAAPAAAKPETPSAPPAAADDLTVIEGIGPKSAAALNEAGITTFAQIADMTPEALESLLKEKKVRLVGSTETWPQQAALAAKGDFEGLDALKARIKGGVIEEEDPDREDDLTLIEGIGPKSAAALKEAGIKTFSAVARMTPDALESLLKEKKVRLVASTDTWPQQAALAAKGDFAGLDALKDRIKGGVLQDD